jgi:NADH-quinone oxidoreductase subunit I
MMKSLGRDGPLYAAWGKAGTGNDGWYLPRKRDAPAIHGAGRDAQAWHANALLASRWPQEPRSGLRFRATASRGKSTRNDLPSHLAAGSPGPIIKGGVATSAGVSTSDWGEGFMRVWFNNIVLAVKTVTQGMYITLWYFFQTYRRRTFTERFEYPELPVPVKPRYRGFHRFDLTTCIGCDKCARACPVDCIYIEKIKNPVGKGFRVNGFKIDYTKCMFCALCVDPCPVDCIFMGSTFDQSTFSRDGCIIDYAKMPLEVAWGQATLNPTSVAASKLQVEPVWTKPPDPAPAPKK